MNTEAILMSAYALATQERYDEALRLMKSCPEALQTPSGQDLLARIALEQGQEGEAKGIWEQILSAHPDFEPARKALEAILTPTQEPDEGDGKKPHFVAGIVLLLGVGLALWGVLRKPDTIVQIEERVRTNIVERVVNVPVTSVVTTVVEKVAFVTNTIPVIQREVVTNTIEHVVTKEVEKIVYRKPVAAPAAATNPPPTDVKAPKAPRNDWPSKRATRESYENTWFDRMALGLYIKLGLLPEPRKLPY